MSFIFTAPYLIYRVFINKVAHHFHQRHVKIMSLSKKFCFATAGSIFRQMYSLGYHVNITYKDTSDKHYTTMTKMTNTGMDKMHVTRICV